MTSRIEDENSAVEAGGHVNERCRNEPICECVALEHLSRDQLKLVQRRPPGLTCVASRGRRLAADDPQISKPGIDFKRRNTAEASRLRARKIRDVLRLLIDNRQPSRL